jgi:hypothetical protein
LWVYFGVHFVLQFKHSRKLLSVEHIILSQ